LICISLDKSRGIVLNGDLEKVEYLLLTLRSGVEVFDTLDLHGELFRGHVHQGEPKVLVFSIEELSSGLLHFGVAQVVCVFATGSDRKLAYVLAFLESDLSRGLLWAVLGEPLFMLVAVSESFVSFFLNFEIVIGARWVEDSKVLEVLVAIKVGIVAMLLK